MLKVYMKRAQVNIKYRKSNTQAKKQHSAASSAKSVSLRPRSSCQLSDSCFHIPCTETNLHPLCPTVKLHLQAVRFSVKQSIWLWENRSALLQALLAQAPIFGVASTSVNHDEVWLAVSWKTNRLRWWLKMMIAWDSEYWKCNITVLAWKCHHVTYQ